MSGSSSMTSRVVLRMDRGGNQLLIGSEHDEIKIWSRSPRGAVKARHGAGRWRLGVRTTPDLHHAPDPPLGAPAPAGAPRPTRPSVPAPPAACRPRGRCAGAPRA